MALDATAKLIEIGKRWASVIGSSAIIPLDVRNDRHNPIIDAEALLAFLYPQHVVGKFHIYYDPGNKSYFHPDIVAMLKSLIQGSTAKIPEKELLDRVFDLIEWFFRQHSEDRVPLFGGDGYLISSVKGGERGESSSDSGKVGEGSSASTHAHMHLTEAYSFSITLSIVFLKLAKGLGDRWRQTDNVSGDSYQRLGALRERAGERLTKALAGLVATFAVEEFKQTDWETRTGRDWSRHDKKLEVIRTRLKTLGYPIESEGAFECGWSWAPVQREDGRRSKAEAQDHKDSREFQEIDKLIESILSETAVYGEPAPYFYFTVSALDAIADITSREFRELEILDKEQVYLANRLENLSSIVTTYWRELAFGSDGDEWPVVSFVPWAPSDTDPTNPKQASEYWNLYLLRIFGEDLPSRTQDVEKLIQLLRKLADAGRITRKPFPPKTDPAIGLLHAPGFRLSLLGKDRGNRADVEFQWDIYDFAPQLLKVCGHALLRASETRQREELSKLAAEIWEHLDRRADEGGGSGMFEGTSWDRIKGGFPSYDFALAGSKEPLPGTPNKVGSWYFTERIVEALVAVAAAQAVQPDASTELRSVCISLVNQLEYRLQRPDRRQSSEIETKERSELLNSVQEARGCLDNEPDRAFGILTGVAQDIASPGRRKR
jgi:hypothetical protein